MQVTVEVEGLHELTQTLDELPLNIQERILKAWARDKASQVAKAASLIAPRGLTGNLQRSLYSGLSKKSVALRKSGSTVRAVAGGSASHFHLVNLGTRQRFTKSTKANRGSMPANPFFARAAEPIVRQALSEFDTEIGDRIQKLLNTAIKRTYSRG